MDNTIQDYQARHIAGDLLSNDEQQTLVLWLEKHPDERGEFLLNESMDSQLRLLASLGHTDAVEDFVTATIGRAKSNWDNKDAFIVPVRTSTVSRTTSASWSQLTIAICTAAAVLIGLSLSFLTWDGGIFQGKPSSVDLTHAQLLNPQEISWKLEDGHTNRLRITAGNAKLRFDSGATAIASAPAIVEVKSHDQLLINRGKTTAVVPPKAVGFTVITPRARIVDLGTEFSVDVADSGTTNTTVSKGAVTFEPRLASGDFAKPFRLTAAGLNQASTDLSHVGNNVPYVRTTATSSSGAFIATVHSNGTTEVFRSRPELESFLKRTQPEAQRSPSTVEENGEQVLESTGQGSQSSVNASTATSNRAKSQARAEMLKQLQWMQQQQPDNPALQGLLDNMLQEGQQYNSKNNEKNP